MRFSAHYVPDAAGNVTRIGGRAQFRDADDTVRSGAGDDKLGRGVSRSNMNFLLSENVKASYSLAADFLNTEVDGGESSDDLTAMHRAVLPSSAETEETAFQPRHGLRQQGPDQP